MKLAAKVLVSLALVVIAALTTASLLIERYASASYRSYLDEAQQRQLAQAAAQAEALYTVLPDWESVQDYLDGLPVGAQVGAMRGRMMGRGTGKMGPPLGEVERRFVLVDPETGAPLGFSGDPISPERLGAGVPVQLAGGTVALLVPASAVAQLGLAEQAVLSQVQQAILVAALLSGLLALVLGSFLVWTILQPLRALQRGVATLAEGNLQTQVRVRSRDELGDLATAFNHMAQSLHHQEELRKRMLADIAHELRTPLSVVQGNLQAILEGVYPLALDEIRTVYDETQLLSRLVHDLHELARAEAGNLPFDRQPVPAAGALEHMVSRFAPLAEAKSITLTVVRPLPDVTLFADPDRLYQILHNLLGNAVRHTPAGGTIQLGAAPGGRETGRIWISDTGPGIPPEHLKFVFERFYRADRSRTRAGDPTAGAGLGLAIVRALAEAHSGHVGAESTPGVGSTFWVELPCMPPPDSAKS